MVSLSGAAFSGDDAQYSATATLNLTLDRVNEKLALRQATIATTQGSVAA